MFPALLSFLRNFPLGAFLGAILGIGFMLIIESELSDEYTKYATYGISALVALLGSGLAVAGVLANIENQNALAVEERNRSLSAAKSYLPVALSELSNFALKKIQDCVDTSAFDPEHIIQAPDRVDPEVFSVIKECIRHADDVSAHHLATLIRIYQVRLAWERRPLEEIKSKPTKQTLGGQNRIYHAIDWALFCAICDAAFPYARSSRASTQMKPEIDPERIFIAFNSANVFPENYTDLTERIESFIERKAYIDRHNEGD